MIKNILIPTDFSECAAHATHAGIQLAQRAKATVHLLTSNTDDLGFTSTASEHNASQLFEPFVQVAQQANVPIKTIVTYGNLVSDVKAHIAKYDIDCIVMGSKGVNSLADFILGSNTQKMLRVVDIPVLIIKSATPKINFDSIVYASAFDLKEQQDFTRFLAFIQPFEPKQLHLLAIDTSTWFGQPAMLMQQAMKGFQALSTRIPTQTHFYKDLGVEKGIRKFSQSVHADLMVISNHNKSTLHRIFSGSIVEILVAEAVQPVLSFDFKEA